MPDKYFIRQAGILTASGKDLTDFMNRMSTNDFRKSGINEYKKTVLTSDKGRIIDLVTLINLNEGFLLLTSPFNQEKVKTHLEKYIILDDVSFGISNKNYMQFIIIPDNADDAAVMLTEGKLSVNEVISINETDFIFRDNFMKEKLILICTEESAGLYEDKLKNLQKMTSDEYENFRIEYGIPDSINELNEDINPIECGLKEYISFVKGCYIGQEVIARLDSQGKIPKQMVKMVSPVKLAAGDKIYLNDKEAGFISSTVMNDDKCKALGFIRSTELDYGREYSVLNNKEKIKINILQLN